MLPGPTPVVVTCLPGPPYVSVTLGYFVYVDGYENKGSQRATVVELLLCCYA